MWALNRIKIKNCVQPNPDNNSNSGTNQEQNITIDSTKMKTYIVVPYSKGLSKSCNNECGKHGIQVFFRG